MKSFEFIKSLKYGDTFEIDGQSFMLYEFGFDFVNRCPVAILLDEQKDVYFPVTLNFVYGVLHPELSNLPNSRSNEKKTEKD